jgi:hypothetical protein
VIGRSKVCRSAGAQFERQPGYALGHRTDPPGPRRSLSADAAGAPVWPLLWTGPSRQCAPESSALIKEPGHLLVAPLATPAATVRADSSHPAFVGGVPSAPGPPGPDECCRLFRGDAWHRD